MKGCKKKVGGKSLRKATEGGPIDTYNHKFKSKVVISKHINDMEKDKAILEQQIQYEEDKYKEKQSILEEKKNKDFQDKQSREEKDFEMYQNSQNQDIEHTNRAVNSFGHTVHFLVVEVIAPFIAWLVRQLKFIVIKVCVVLAWLWEQIFNCLDAIFNGTGMTAVYKLIAYVIAFLIVLILVALFILWLLSLFAISPIKWYGSDANGYDCVVPSEISINLNNFGKLYSFDKIGNGIQSKLDDVLSKPIYLEMPSFDYDFKDFLKKPFDFVSKWVTYLYKSILYTEPVQDGLNAMRYTRNLSVNTVDYMYGKDPEADPSVRNRKEEIKGRSDNIINIDSKLFSDKKMLQSKNIDGGGNYVVNIGRPKDIEWNMPEGDYVEADYDKLPNSLLSQKDANNVSLDDKKTIVIPWITKNNNYVLSCDDAYFKNSVQEKANIFIDTGEETCSLNIESKPVAYKDNKKRYKITNDLSTFL